MPKYALLIAVSGDHYPEALKPFPSAKRNVEAMGRVLMLPEVGGFADVKAVLEPDPMQMQEAIEEFFRQRTAQDLALLFFSGQMVLDERGKLYFATRLTRYTPEGSLIKYTAVPTQFVQDLMSGCAAQQQVMVLDCGVASTVRPGVSAHKGLLSLQSQLAGSSWVTLLSSSSPRPSPEHHGSDLSLYTHCLLEGMATGAADLDRDGVISAQDLHRYVSAQVRSLAPEVTPQLMALREENLHTAIARVPILDSRRQYQEKVRQYVTNGSLSPIGRTILDRLRQQLSLSPAEALAIENEILQPFREQYESLQKYQRSLTKALELEYPLGDRTLRELRELQDILMLSDEQVVPVQEAVMRPFAERATQQQQKQAQYQQAFEQAIAHQFPLSEAAHQQLQRLQFSLGLREVDLRPLEEAAIARYQALQETRQRHQRQYREALLCAVEAGEPIDSATRLYLQKLQHSLGLSVDDAARLEQQVNDEVQAKRAVYRGNLTVYRQEFEEAIAQQQIPAKPTRDRLQQLQQALELRDVDIIQTEAEVVRQDKLRRYEQEFVRRVRQVFLPSDATLEKIQQDLKPLQESLMLNDTDVVSIQRQLAAHAKAQRQDYHSKLRQYGEEYVRALQQPLPLSDATRQALSRSWQTLGLREIDAHEVERIVYQRWQVLQSTQTAAQNGHTTAEQTGEQTVEAPVPIAAEPPEATDSWEKTDATPAPSSSEDSQLEAQVPQQSVPEPIAPLAQFPETFLQEHAPNKEPVQQSVPEPIAPLAQFPETLLQEHAPDKAPVQDNILQDTPPPPPESNASESNKSVDVPLAGASTNSPTHSEEPPLAADEAVINPLDGYGSSSDELVMPPPPPEAIAVEPANPFITEISPLSPPEVLVSTSVETDPSPPPFVVSGPPSPSASSPAPPPPSAQPTEDLSSERGINYTTLRELLQHSQWREADSLTFRLMLQATGRQAQGWLDAACLDSFPCTDLNTLNKLWVQYSKGRFGFTAQQPIYRSISNPKLKDPRRAIEFGKSTGWVLAGKVYPVFKPYDQLDFSPRAPQGHLPAKWFWVLPAMEAVRSGGLGMGRGFAGVDSQGMMAALMKRLAECNL